MPDTLYRFELTNFLRKIHFDNENNEITAPDRIIEHFKMLCEDADLESSIEFLNEMRRDIDKTELVEYFQKTKK